MNRDDVRKAVSDAVYSRIGRQNAAPLFFANWKMNKSAWDVRAFLKGLRDKALLDRENIAIFPPFPYLYILQSELRYSKAGFGAQDVSESASGAFTGEVSAAMLADCGCRYCIVGHSERRAMHGESDALVARKAAALLKEGVCPVVCVGESLAERESGAYEAVLARQMAAIMPVMGKAKFILAYEPVWAIGTGRAATSEQIGQTHAFLRCQLSAELGDAGTSAPILYGGSVSEGNAAEIGRIPNVSGFLIGGASLDVGKFSNIVGATAPGRP